MAPLGERSGSCASGAHGVLRRWRILATPFGPGHVCAQKTSFPGLRLVVLGSILQQYGMDEACDGQARGYPLGSKDHQSAQCNLTDSHCLILQRREQTETVKMELSYAV